MGKTETSRLREKWKIACAYLEFQRLAEAIVGASDDGTLERLEREERAARKALSALQERENHERRSCVADLAYPGPGSGGPPGLQGTLWPGGL